MDIQVFWHAGATGAYGNIMFFYHKKYPAQVLNKMWIFVNQSFFQGWFEYQ